MKSEIEATELAKLAVDAVKEKVLHDISELKQARKETEREIENIQRDFQCEKEMIIKVEDEKQKLIEMLAKEKEKRKIAEEELRTYESKINAEQGKTKGFL